MTSRQALVASSTLDILCVPACQNALASDFPIFASTVVKLTLSSAQLQLIPGFLGPGYIVQYNSSHERSDACMNRPKGSTTTHKSIQHC